MALKAILEKIDGLPAEVAKEYKRVEGTDGKVTFQLDVEKTGGLELADTTGLMSTIEKLRPFEAKVGRYGTITPEEAIANKTKVGELTAKLENVDKDGKGGDARVKEVRETLDREWSEKLTKETARSEARLGEVVRLRKYEAARASVIKVGFKTAEKLVTPLLESEIEVTEDETATDPKLRFKTTIKGPNGPRRIPDKDHGDRLMTPEERALELAKSDDLKRYLDAPEPTKKPDVPGSRRTPAHTHTNQPSDEPQGFVDPIQDLASALGAI